VTPQQAGVRLLALAEHDGIVLTKDDKIALQIAAQMLRLQGGSDGEFKVANIISHRTGHGMVDVQWLGQQTQLEIVKAREIAWMLLEVAAGAETEAQLVQFLQEQGMPQPAAIGMLQAFRAHKEAHRDQDSLLADKRDTH
jgi:hypothetical protein